MALQLYVDAWAASMRALLALDLDEVQGRQHTALPGWRVHEIVAHLVHIEEVLAFGTDEGHYDSRTAVTSAYTEAGVANLRDVPLAQLLDRLRSAVSARAKQLSPLPADPQAPADRAPGGLSWDWETLLRNRAIDAWMHEQDIRRAIGRPGGLDTPAAQLCVHTFAAALPYVVGKRAEVPPSHAVRFEVDGAVPFVRTIAVRENGRAEVVDPPTDTASTTVIAMDSGAFARLAGGREPLATFDVRVTGDAEVAARVLASLAITP